MLQDPSAARPLPPMLDVEASGFGRASYPIEVGFVLSDGHPVCTLIRPEPDWTHWDEAAQAVHHIDRATLLRRGRPVRDVVRLLNDCLGGLTVYSDAWAHDYSWLGRLFDASELSPRFRLESLRSLLGEEQARCWHAAKASIIRERGAQRHRASSDARLLQLTFQRLLGGSNGAPIL
ncbi:MAG: hypothetical protein FGM55_10465 [Rhodoferax sp.]|nr:hypothetical protein [Rhodoferax sp.]